MKKKLPKSYVLMFTSLAILLSFSPETTEKIRGVVAALGGPSWEALAHAKLALFSPFARNSTSSATTEELKKLQLENRLLKTELQRVKNLFREDLDTLFQQHEAIPAKIIFRSPTAWNSSFWINVGHRTNEALGQQIVVKNSPIVLGTSVVGILDYVGAKQSRVRLITDPGLCPSVRAVRTSNQGTVFLAKGELRGGEGALWPSETATLRGVGFNYDFPDHKGPARDLRTGKPVNHPGEALPLVKVNDCLVTTGMDGLFPAGLDVAIVTKIYPLKEGDYYYELEAKSTVGQLKDLSYVFVLPPVGYEPNVFAQE